MRVFLCFIFCFSIIIVLRSQCSDGDIFLRNQNDIDDYWTDYPECDTIKGALFIGRSDNDWANINDLTPLEGIKRIEGDFTLHLINKIEDLKGLDSLKYVGAEFFINGYKTEDFNGLQQLDSIAGKFHLRNAFTVATISGNIDSLKNLKYIGGGIEVRFSWIDQMDILPRQTNYGGDIILDEVSISSIDFLEDLQTIDGSLIIRSTKLQNLAALQNLSGNLEDLEIQKNEHLTELIAFSSIDSIHGHFYLQSFDPMIPALSPTISLDEFNNLEFIGEDMRIDHNVESLIPFSNLKHIGGDLDIHTEGVQWLTGLENVEFLGGNLSLAMPDLLSLKELSHFTQIQGIVNLLRCGRLKNLYGLHNIDTIWNDFIINLCDSLASLSILNSGLIVEDTWMIINNPDLEICDVPALCNHLRSERGYIIENNGALCSAVEDIICLDNSFSGFSYYDFDQNGIKDGIDSPIPNVQIEVNNQDTLITTRSGYYVIQADQDLALNVKLLVPDQWVSTSDSEFEVTFMSGDSSNYGNNFGLFPLFEQRNLALDINSSTFLCNRTSRMCFDIMNSGTQIEKAWLDVAFPDLITPVISEHSSFSWDASGQILQLEFDSLFPFSQSQFCVNIELPGPAWIGEEFSFQGSVMIDSSNVEITVAEKYYTEILRCAYDPNDKLVAPEGIGGTNQTDKGEFIEYTVRFQNTGNFEARDIVIRDTLSELLDLQSFLYLSSSHELVIKRHGRNIEFIFNNINLPDSTSNFEESQGYVKYKIRSEADIDYGQIIQNTASIYFDLNPPIRTNTVRTEIQMSSSISEILPQFIRVYPSPAHDFILVEHLENNNSNWVFTIFNLEGIQVSEGIHSQKEKIDIQSLANGIYFLLVHDLDNLEIRAVQKFIKHE